MLEAHGGALWENGSGFGIVFKQQHLESCFEGIWFLNGGKEDAQAKQQIHSGGLGQSEALSSSVFSSWAEV